MDSLVWTQYILLYFGILLYLRYFCVTFEANENFKEFQQKDLNRSMWFLTVIICSELIIIFSMMVSRCANVSRAILYPILIWIFIFLGTKIILLAVPGFKSAFSDVLGYAFTYGYKQNEFLDKLLSASSSNDNLVTRIISDKSLLFNSIVPGNFNEVWDSLKPNANPALYNDESTKQELLNWVVQRDHIGEGCWLAWSGTLCISIISLYVSSFPCEITAVQVVENKQTYDKQIRDDLNKQQLNFVNY